MGGERLRDLVRPSPQVIGRRIDALPKDDTRSHDSACSVNVATYNVFSLRRLGAWHVMGKELHRRNISIAGIQEARPYATGISVISGFRYDYFVASSQAAKKAALGCQIWIAKKQIWDSGPHVTIERNMIAILEADPRFLIVRLRTKRDNLLLVSAHAIHHDGNNDDDVSTFWMVLRHHISTHAKMGATSILFIDANAYIDSNQPRDVPLADAFSDFLTSTNYVEQTRGAAPSLLLLL